MENKNNRTRFCAPVKLIYYYDKGWVLQNKELEYSKESLQGIEETESIEVQNEEEETYEY